MSAHLDIDPKYLDGLLSPLLSDLIRLDEAERADFVRSMSPEQLAWLPYLWEFWARPEQIWRPGPEMITLYQAGRGWGKSRTWAQAVIWVASNPELCGFGKGQLREDAPTIALVGRTAHDCIATMINGPSGIIACSPPWFRPKFESSKKLLQWPNGVRAYYYTAEKPETLRGPNIGFAWADEVAFFRSHKGFQVSALENIEQALRKGLGKAVYTTTPIPTIAMFSLHERSKPTLIDSTRPDEEPASRPASPDDTAGAEDAGCEPASAFALEAVAAGLAAVAGAAPPTPAAQKWKPAAVRIVRGSSLDNAANVRREWVEQQRARMGTRLGRQEVGGELLSGNPLTLFPFETFNKRRVNPTEPREQGETMQAYLRRVLELRRICVAADPNGSEDPERAEFGIQVVGTGKGGKEYSLEDLSGHHTHTTWPGLIYDAAVAWGADAIVAETNYGGAMIRGAMETHVRGLAGKGQDWISVPFVAVTAKGGKASRLKIFAQAYEDGLVYQVGSPHLWAPLEGQLHAFNPGEDPDKQVARIEVNGHIETLLFDRMDARVWAHLWLSDHELARSKSVWMLGASGGDRARQALSGLFE
jgi:phage terminase large subunit-like protein